MESIGFNFNSARTELLGKDSDEIIDFVYRLNTCQSTDHISSRVKSIIVRLGWLPDGSSVLSPHGMSVADSIREYVFWIERDRTLHCEGRIEHLSAAHYAGKSVIEIGCGFGCNLIPISQVAKRVVGVEPNSIYTAMNRILCEREGIAPMDIRAGSGEQIPVSDEVFDIVLCVSAHQYMDVRVSIREMARILAPGGELQIVGGTLGSYMRDNARPIFASSLRRSVPYAITILNTLSYMGTGRRAYQRSTGPSTAYPIYPTRSRMIRWLAGAGLSQKRLPERIGGETFFSFETQRA